MHEIMSQASAKREARDRALAGFTFFVVMLFRSRLKESATEACVLWDLIIINVSR